MPMPPTDPVIYRFYELVMVNGPAWKALIEEEFGDGIMSAIDFDMVLERLPNPKGDRVKITMSGKFLPYKYYGASGNIPEYGFKEESRLAVVRTTAVAKLRRLTFPPSPAGWPVPSARRSWCGVARAAWQRRRRRDRR